MNDNEKLYKLYHRNYKNIEELYDDLSDAILNIGLENNKIIIHSGVSEAECYVINYLDLEICDCLTADNTYKWVCKKSEK